MSEPWMREILARAESRNIKLKCFKVEAESYWKMFSAAAWLYHGSDAVLTSYGIPVRMRP